MSAILYLQASPRGPRSKSIQVADAFINAYTARHPSAEITLLNVFEADLPAFDAPAVAAKFKIPHGLPAEPDEVAAWRGVEAVIAQFQRAQMVVLAAPMWNFGIPYRLKQYIDIVVQPNLTFKVGENGYEGLLKGRRLVGVYARGGAYAAGTPAEAFDLQIRYVEQIFGFMGFGPMHRIVVEPTLAGGEQAAQQAVQAAIQQAQSLAQTM